MADFKSHLPVQTHKDGATFTASSDYGVGVGGYESGGGVFLTVAMSANREFLVKNAILESIVFAEDSAHSDGDNGAFILAVRNDTPGSLVSTDGDYAPIQVDSIGRVRTIGDNTLTNLEKAEDSVHNSGDIGLMPLGVRQDVTAPLAGDGDYIPFSMDRNGAVRVTVTDPNISAAEVSDYQTTAAVAAAASTDHDYAVTAAKTLILNRIIVSASGRIKVEVILDPAGTPETKFVLFNSTANPNIIIPIENDIEVAATLVVRITITNLDEDAQDVYSTLLGDEV